ncbi:hypothetical protein GCM10010216_72430 [Streptomyces flaveolus]|nr:hypothetical protein GCM10010216_72430 [Streptomyces flaveolus]
MQIQDTGKDETAEPGTDNSDMNRHGFPSKEKAEEKAARPAPDRLPA